MTEEVQTILDAVLASDFAKEQRKERNIKEELEFYGYVQRATDFEIGNIEGFFEQGESEIVKVTEVWKWLKNQVKDDLDGVWLDPKTLLSRINSKGYVTSAKTVAEMLESLCHELVELYEERIEAGWSLLSIEKAREVLPKGVHIALLNKDGKLTREPYMVCPNIKAKVTWKITEETRPSFRDWVKIKDRYIQVTVDPPVKVKDQKYTGQAIKLKDTEVNAVVIQKA